MSMKAWARIGLVITLATVWLSAQASALSDIAVAWTVSDGTGYLAIDADPQQPMLDLPRVALGPEQFIQTVDDLSSPEFAVREAASIRLHHLPQAQIDALRLMLDEVDDAEVRRRLDEVVNHPRPISFHVQAEAMTATGTTISDDGRTVVMPDKAKLTGRIMLPKGPMHVVLFYEGEPKGNVRLTLKGAQNDLSNHAGLNQYGSAANGGTIILPHNQNQQKQVFDFSITADGDLPPIDRIEFRQGQPEYNYGGGEWGFFCG
jgi:hypothetical protein